MKYTVAFTCLFEDEVGIDAENDTDALKKAESYCQERSLALTRVYQEHQGGMKRLVLSSVPQNTPLKG